VFQKISHKIFVFGYILSSYKVNGKKNVGVNFLTPAHLSHQVAFIKHPKKHLIKPHYHLNNIRKIKYTSEVLIILKGKLRVDFYISNNKYVFSKILKKNNIIILNKAGHGFKIINPVEMIEVKQGPYNSKIDKKLLLNVDEKIIKIK